VATDRRWRGDGSHMAAVHAVDRHVSVRCRLASVPDELVVLRQERKDPFGRRPSEGVFEVQGLVEQPRPAPGLRTCEAP